jgi:hypothetical protein
MPESGPKTSPSVHNGVFQTSAKLQWQWHSFFNSNGVLQKHQSYSGTDPINPNFFAHIRAGSVKTNSIRSKNGKINPTPLHQIRLSVCQG